MKFKLYVMSLLLMLSVAVGCHKDSPVIPDDETSEADTRACKAAALLNFFCEAESGADGNIIYTPDWGTVLYNNNPTVRYVVADDLDDARQWFSYFVQAAEPNIMQDITEYKIEGYGSIRFTPSTTTDRIATIHVDFAILPEVKEIVFIFKERWPDNNTSPFEYGAVYYHRPTGYNFVCIATSESGTGILITFDKKDWNIQWTSLGIKKIYILDLESSLFDFDKLRRFMYKYDWDIKQYVRRDVAVSVFEGKMALAPKIYSDIFLCRLESLSQAHKTYVISSDHRKIEFKGELLWPWLDPNKPDLSAYILSKSVYFQSNSAPSFINQFEMIFRP